MTKSMTSQTKGVSLLGIHTKTLKNLFTNHGLKVIKIAGKPIMLMGRTEADFISQDSSKVQKLLEIEFKFCEEPSIVGFGGHLHIVAQKSPFQ